MKATEEQPAKGYTVEAFVSCAFVIDPEGKRMGYFSADRETHVVVKFANESDAACICKALNHMANTTRKELTALRRVAAEQNEALKKVNELLGTVGLRNAIAPEAFEQREKITAALSSYEDLQK